MFSNVGLIVHAPVQEVRGTEECRRVAPPRLPGLDIRRGSSQPQQGGGPGMVLAAWRERQRRGQMRLHVGDLRQSAGSGDGLAVLPERFRMSRPLRAPSSPVNRVAVHNKINT